MEQTLKRKTIDIFKKQSDKKLSMITCYDYSMAKLLNETDIDSILVGDSLGMVMQGHEDTLSVTVDDIIYHTKAVNRGNKKAFIVADMPFLSYHISKEATIENAGNIIRHGGAQAVKLEGGRELIDHIKAVISAKIPVIGHLGLTPQSINTLGGFKVQGKQSDKAREIVLDALALQEAGVSAIVLECIPEALASFITEKLSIPTIGIGCGNVTNGQVLVIHDVLGMFNDVKPKFVKNFQNIGQNIITGVNSYIDEVKNESFPAENHIFSIDKDIINEIKKEFS